MITAPDDTQWDEDEPPLSEDDLLIQRYLDGTLDDEQATALELRAEEDAAFATRLDGYRSLFGALDVEGALRSPAPLGLAEAAVAAWAPVWAEAHPQRGLADLFGGLPSAAAVFAAADVVLAGLLVALMAARGPVELFKGWVLGLKDAALWTLSFLPTTDQLTVALPAVTLLALAALYGTWTVGQRVVRRAEVLR